MYILSSLLLGALACLVALLLLWGKETVDLRKQLFLDKAQLAVRETVRDSEENRFCFSMYADFEVPSMPSFSLDNPIAGNRTGPVSFYYYNAEGDKVERPDFPLIGDALMQMSLRFEFKDMPPDLHPDSANDFEQYIMEVYDRSLVDENGKRLTDVSELDTMLELALTELNPDVNYTWSISRMESGEVLYPKGEAKLLAGKESISAIMFEDDPDIRPLLLTVNLLNMESIFHRDRRVVYITSGLLALISFSLIIILTRFYLHQKKLMQRQKDFVHGMTHEFNTPIANIRLSAQKLSKSSENDVRKIAGILDAESKKLQAGINLVMTAALIEKDELLLQKEEVDLRLLLESTIEKNKIVLSESGINLNINIAEGDYHLTGDAFHLENVFQNMINNVKRHSGASLLGVSGERVNGHIDLCFSDNGRGIPVEYRQRIFDKFESRGDNGRKNGYGLGLYYSKMIIDMHGGMIELDNGKNNGCAFNIQLPA